MCELVSLLVTEKGEVKAILGEDRLNLIMKGENPDSHTMIAKHFGIDEDKTWKYEIPISQENPPKTVDELWGLLKYDGGSLRYNGGLPEEEIPFTYVKGIRDWIEKNWEELQKTFTLLFLERRYKNG